MDSIGLIMALIKSMSHGEGKDGKSAYAYAVEGGFTGTEEEFAAKLAAEIPTVDSTLAKSGQAADAATVGDRLSALSEEIANLQTSGLTTAQVKALDGMFKVCAFTKDNVSAEYTAFKTAFGIADSGDGGETEVTLTSISATYSGGDVAVGTAVADLTGIVVTAHYSDGSTAEVTGYTMSGAIAEGSNTVTVTYQGKTATFTVTGVAESGVSNETTWTDGVAYTYTSVKDEYLETNGTLAQYNGWDRTPYLYCAGASRLRVVVENPTASIPSSAQYNGFFDENKNFISQFKYNTIDKDTVGAYVDVSVPADAVYFIASGKNTVITDNLSNGPAVSFTPYK